MAVTTKTWSPGNLWPPAPFPVWFAPGGGPTRATAAWGEPGIDVGSLRTAKNGTWEIFMGPQGWVDFDPSSASHMGHANRANRYGPGQSFGEGLLNGHARVLRDLIKQKLGGDPTPMEVMDVGFNRAQAGALGLLSNTPGEAPPPAAATAEQLDRMEGLLRKIAESLKTPLSVLILAVLLSGCSALRTLIPGGVTAADAEWSGVKSAQPVSIVGAIDPRAGAIAALLEGLGQEDPVGVLLPVTLIGETQPRWVLCTDEYVARCKAFPLNAKVKFGGRPIGPGLIWKPSRLVADDFND